MLSKKSAFDAADFFFSSRFAPTWGCFAHVWRLFYMPAIEKEQSKLSPRSLTLVKAHAAAVSAISRECQPLLEEVEKKDELALAEDMVEMLKKKVDLTNIEALYWFLVGTTSKLFDSRDLLAELLKAGRITQDYFDDVDAMAVNMRCLSVEFRNYLVSPS